MRLEDANGRGPTRTGVKHCSGETDGSGSNGHGGSHGSLPPRPEDVMLEVAQNTTEVLAETLEVAANAVSVVWRN